VFFRASLLISIARLRFKTRDERVNKERGGLKLGKRFESRESLFSRA